MTRCSTPIPLLAAAAVAVLAGPACSALVSPDESELDPGAGSDGGGVDGGTSDAGGTDSGGSDSGDIDAGEDAGVDAGPEPECSGGCDDGVGCTVDECVADDTCESTPDDSACGEDEMCNPASGCVPIVCEEDSDCDDGMFCNGEETCDPSSGDADPVTGCVGGEVVDCGDGYGCTADTCDEDSDECVNAADDGMCDDGVDCTVDTCDASLATDDSGCVNIEDDSMCSTSFCRTGGTCDASAGGCVGGDERDCRDGDPCTADSCDDSAMTCVHEGRDEDGDGHAAETVSGRDCSAIGDDCDDSNPSVSPSAPELCNGRDDDCDGSEDEGCTPIPDECSDAEEITVSAGGSATIMGTLGDYTADVRTPCGRSGAADAFYYIDVSETVDITIDTVGSTADTVLGVSTECDSDGFRMGCDDDIDTGRDTDSRIWVHRFGPGLGMTSRRLYIVVDGFDSGEVGDFTLNVSVETAHADSCRMPLDVTGGGSLVGFMPIASAIGGPRGSCQSPGDRSAEAIATFEGPSDGNARFTTYTNDFDPDLYVRSAPCASGTEQGCEAGDGSGSAGYTYSTRLDVSVAPSTRYYLFVDGGSATDHYFCSFEP